MKFGENPTVSSENLSSRLSDFLNSPNSAEAKQLVANWREAVKSHFSLSQIQLDALASIDKGQVDLIQGAIAAAAAHGGNVEVILPGETKDAKDGSIVIRAYNPSGADANIHSQARIVVPIAHCSFGADCRNWRCGWGPA